MNTSKCHLYYGASHPLINLVPSFISFLVFRRMLLSSATAALFYLLMSREQEKAQETEQTEQ